MSFLDRFKSSSVPSSATFRLTQMGTEKLQEFSGDPQSRVLVALETRGTSNVTEISQSAGMSRGQVERLIPRLVKGGYVQYMSSAMGDEG